LRLFTLRSHFLDSEIHSTNAGAGWRLDLSYTQYFIIRIPDGTYLEFDTAEPPPKQPFQL
jgi:hypothetical protein